MVEPLEGFKRMTMPWLHEPLQRALETLRGHAFLVHGPAGIGQFEFSLRLAQAWLCESDIPTGQRPCGICASCKLVAARSHPDLLVLLPEALRESLGWNGGDDADSGASDDKGSKRKPSKDIRVDEVRRAIGFAQSTSSRGRGKVVVLHPAERMNGVSANALLKTLEEPAGASSRLLLSCTAPQGLLPTIRSRCQSFALTLPPDELASEWLAGHAVDGPGVMLAAAGGQPQEALDWFKDGMTAAVWVDMPRHLARGDASAFSGWPLPRMLDLMQKVCHDQMRVAAGAAPRYFPAQAMVPAVPLSRLTDWSRSLADMARQIEHPWNAPLLVESLTEQAKAALAGRSASQGSDRR
jgi:DNA polymerase-3 subunit delta'